MMKFRDKKSAQINSTGASTTLSSNSDSENSFKISMQQRERLISNEEKIAMDEDLAYFHYKIIIL